MSRAPWLVGQRKVLLAGLLSALSALGCGPQFDPSNEVKTLRVMGVKKDKPYAQPGDDVNLQLLWHDPQGRTDVQSLFLGGCVNPPGDLYYGCFAQYGQTAAQGSLPDIGEGDKFKVTLPKDIISSRPALEPGQPRYGLYIVFFAVCAGTIDFSTSGGRPDGSGGLPIRCLDDAGKPLGSQDFVAGYTSIYSFENASNANPAFSVDDAGLGQFTVADKALVADCVGDECQVTPPVEVNCDAEPDRCIKACDDDGDPTCPEIDVKPEILQKVEKDEVSTKLFGANVTEQMWVNYYIDRGGISEVRLVNDTNSGWNPKYRGQLYAPKAKGPLQIWAVVHDNRGGMEFSRITLGVK